jgi:predicted nucleotidyltransferase
MSSYIQKLSHGGLIHPPKWLAPNVIYECIMGSVAYGVSSDTSDFDLYAICIPLKHDVFPHLKGEINGFGRQKQGFEQFQQHHVYDKDALGGSGRNYDVTCYNIVKYFTLAMENNPNIVDSLYVKNTCVLYSTLVGQHLRENRSLFLHKGAYHKFKGYAYSQLSKLSTNKNSSSSKRKELYEQHGYDTKFAYHVIRLIDECEQILTLGDIDLERSREMMKSVRRGEWTEEKVRKHFEDKEKSLEQLYRESSLQHSPDESKIKSLLLECLEMHYGSLSDCVKLTNVDINSVLDEIESNVAKLRRNFNG